MKPRVLTTYKILAVALTAAGCTKAVSPDPTEPAAAPVREERPATRAIASAQAIPAPPPERPASNEAALIALRAELGKAQPEDALAHVAHFRPLCDPDGYPLVGNLMNKAESDAYKPSAFCAEVRRQASR